MPRRTSNRADSKVIETQSTETIVRPTSTPKKGRRVVGVETAEVVMKVEKSTPAKTSRKVKADVDSDEEDISPITKSPAKININKVKAKAVLEDVQSQKQKKSSAKRKAKTEDDEDEDGEEAGDNKVKKKRKTKEEKEAKAMPLAERTLMGTLKKAMYIGAHVSAAGGNVSEFNTIFRQDLIRCLLQVCKTQSTILFISVGTASRCSSNRNANGLAHP
jgi:AP endonuclease-1